MSPSSSVFFQTPVGAVACPVARDHREWSCPSGAGRFTGFSSHFSLEELR